MKWLSLSRLAALSFLALLAGAVWIWASRANPYDIMPGAASAPRQEFSAPDFWLQTSAGETIRLLEQQGKPLLINVWSSWRLPCKAEIPGVQRVYEEYEPLGFTVLAVNATSQDDSSRALAFARELGLAFPILLDTNGLVSQLYEIRAVPTTLLIDRQGVIREVVIGGPMGQALQRIRVSQLLEETPRGLFEQSGSWLLPGGRGLPM